MWMLPLCTLASVAAHWAAGAASQLALPFYKELGAEQAALWRVNAAHLLYSSVTGAGGGGCLCSGLRCARPFGTCRRHFPLNTPSILLQRCW